MAMFDGEKYKQFFRIVYVTFVIVRRDGIHVSTTGTEEEPSDSNKLSDIYSPIYQTTTTGVANETTSTGLQDVSDKVSDPNNSLEAEEGSFASLANDISSTTGSVLEDSSLLNTESRDTISNTEGLSENNAQLQTASAESITEETIYSSNESATIGDHSTDYSPATSDKQEGDDTASLDCETIIVIVSIIFGLVLVSVTAGCLCRKWRIRKEWKRKFEEEKGDAGIGTKDDFSNTIVNENYLDFNESELQINQDEDSEQTGREMSKQPDQSPKTSGTCTSEATSRARNSASHDRSGLSFLGQQRLRASRILPSVLFVKRSKSSYSEDTLEDQDPNSRVRASTFTHGKRRKIDHDGHYLVDHIETEHQPGILETVDNILQTQNKHMVTEL